MQRHYVLSGLNISEVRPSPIAVEQHCQDVRWWQTRARIEAWKMGRRDFANGKASPGEPI